MPPPDRCDSAKMGGAVGGERPPEQDGWRVTRRRILALAPLVPSIVAYVVVGIVVVVPTLALPWWTNTEEFPYAQEVIRFLSGDFRQRFFDIPGTPLMFISAAVFAIPKWIMGLGGDSGFALFSRQMNVLMEIMRSIEVLAFVVAGWFMYLTAKRFVSRWAAGFAAALLAASPVVYVTLGHTRIEALGLLLVTASIYTWTRALEAGSQRLFLLTGFLAGVTMAARFPLGLAAMPIFVAQSIRYENRLHRTRTMPLLKRLCVAYAGVILVGALLSLLLRLGWMTRNRLSDAYFISIPDADYPHAFSAIRGIWFVLATLVIVVAITLAATRTREWMHRRVSGPVVPLLAGFPIGLVLGVPTIFGGANYFLASINLFIDRNRIHPVEWTALQTFSLNLFGDGGLTAVFNGTSPHNQPGALFHPILVILFVLGITACLWKRGRILPFIALGAPLGLIEQLGKIQGSRHIVGWMPWFILVIAIGFDVLFVRFKGLNREVVQAAAAFAVIVILLLPASTYAAPSNDHSINKVPAMLKVNKWLDTNTTPNEAVFHTCCTAANASVITNWMAQNGVDVPRARGSTIWFGQLSVLEQAGRGLIVIEDYEYRGAYISYYRDTNPAELVDPYHDDRFALMARFPFAPIHTLEIFRFDLTKPVRSSKGGIRVLRASYGSACSAPAAGCAGGVSRKYLGNWTAPVRAVCQARESCTYTVTFGPSGDPAPNVPKLFSVAFACDDDRRRTRTLRAEALGKTLRLSCAARTP